MGIYGGLTTAFAASFAASGRELPDDVSVKDLALLAVATHKLTRLIGRDRVTSAVRAPFTTFQDDAGPGEVDEAARGHGLRRATGELLVCPHCLGMWVATGLVAGRLAAPEVTRWTAATFSIVFASDLLHNGYAKVIETL